MKIYKVHYFNPYNSSASECNTHVGFDNWLRKDFCTTNKQKVTCKKCIKIYRKNNDTFK